MARQKNRYDVMPGMLAMLAFTLAPDAGATPIALGPTPAAQAVGLGEVAEIHIGISGLGAGSAPSLGAFDLDVRYDPGILSLQQVVFGDPLLGDQLDLFGLGSIAIWTGDNLFELSLDPEDDLNQWQSDSFVLAQLRFDTLSVGTSFVEVVPSALSDAAGLPLDAILTQAQIQVYPTASVPEPPTWALLLPALAMAARRLRWPRGRATPP